VAPPALVADLVERFARHRDAYRSGHYNETQLRREFIDPFFKALGWDVDNERGYAEAYKDVIHEDAIRVGGGVKAPDYCFRIGGTRKFFVEAKKPSVDIRGGTHPAYQLRRYAWSAKLPLSILTDFEELAVYDCRVRPARTDPASKARTVYLTYDAYADRWDQIAGIFAREAVLQGSFDQYAESTRRKRGTTEVDDAFLAEIESWRDLLARNIALRNPALSQRELNFGVQRTIDRIIFLRICEDRGLEPYGRLQALLGGPRVYPRLFQLFERADERYNSGLFHFRRDTSRDEAPDALTPALAIDDKPLKAILGRLYYPDSPYEFSVLPADILGQVYEQFLGKVIRLTAGHRAVVEDKPEVKKAGGVYYTPTYIVDYIVEQTVGALLGGPAARNAAVPAAPASGDAGVTPRKRSRGMTPRRAAKLRILDPACGSGSFLLGAYQRLLDWHLDYYTTHNPEKWARGRNPRIYQVGSAGRRQSAEGSRQSAATNRQSAIGNRQSSWRLTTAERKRILLNNIFGVDMDPQAVEVTKLSLLLKVLEGESGETLHRQWELFHERALPDLSCNIKCGNSLIGPDFYRGQQLTLFDEDERLRINVFDWQAEFPAILGGRNPGFDAVIGNPPWLMAGYYVKDSLDYLRRRFRSARGKFDLYYAFIEKGLALLSDGGLLGMIVPNKLFHTRAASVLRKLLAERKCVHRVIDFGDEQLFTRATNYSCILLLGPERQEGPQYMRAHRGLAIAREFALPWSELSGDEWHFLDESTRALFDKLEAIGQPLECLVRRFGTGVQSGADRVLAMKPSTAEAKGLESDVLRPVLRGRDVRRYHVSSNPKLLVFPYQVKQGEFVIMTEDQLKRYPNAYSLLSDNKKALFGMMYLDSHSSFSAPHILTPSLSNRSNFALGTGDLFATGTAGVTSVIPEEGVPEDIRYLLGLINSRLISHYAVSHSPVFSGGYHKFSAPYLRQLPIRRIDASDPSDRRSHSHMVELVDAIQQLHVQLGTARTGHEATALERQIAATDREIDGLVYELYGLTEAEIAIVEGACP